MNRRMLRDGAILFLLGLLTGLAAGAMKNSRAALAAHLEGLMNGTFLLAIGAVWSQLKTGPRLRRLTDGLLTFGAFTNWLATLLGAFWGTHQLTPIAGAGFSASIWEEKVVSVLLVGVVFTVVPGVALLGYGFGRQGT